MCATGRLVWRVTATSQAAGHLTAAKCYDIEEQSRVLPSLAEWWGVMRLQPVSCKMLRCYTSNKQNEHPGLFVGILRFDDVVVSGYMAKTSQAVRSRTLYGLIYIYIVIGNSLLGYGWLASINVANRTLRAASQGTTHLPQGWLTCIQQRRQNQRKTTAADFFLFTQKLFCFAVYLLCPEPRTCVDMHEEEGGGWVGMGRRIARCTLLTWVSARA